MLGASPFPPTLEISGGAERFCVRRIFAVGRNYAAHAREMGNDPDREAPVFFTKIPDGLVPSGAAVPYPPKTKDLHFEVELVVAIGEDGANLSIAASRARIFGYAVGVDLTRRDLQAAARAAGGPWDMAKSFDACAPCGALSMAAQTQLASAARIILDVNGVRRQDAALSEMIWSPEEIVSKLSETLHLRAGDLIFTGTPAGVGPLQRGDRVEAKIEGLSPLTFSIV